MCDGGTFAAAIIGALIGGFFSWFATRQAHKNALEKQKVDKEEAKKALLQAIHDEIETLWDAYQENMGVHLEALDDNKPLLMYYPVTQDYFTIYKGNSSKIGLIKDNDLRKSIVTTYTKAQGLIDTFRLSNEFVGRYEHWDWISYAERENPRHESHQRVRAELDNLTKYAETLKKIHNKLKTQVQELLRMLRKSGVLSENKQTHVIKP